MSWRFLPLGSPEIHFVPQPVQKFLGNFLFGTGSTDPVPNGKIPVNFLIGLREFACELTSSWPPARVEGRVRGALAATTSGAPVDPLQCPKRWFRVRETILFPKAPQVVPKGFSPLPSIIIGFDVKLQPLSSIIVGIFYEF